jgi:uncharacterized protein involved in exopolysaccharide biosynthesis
MAVQQRPDEIGFRFDDLLGIVRRRIWWFLVPSVLGVLGALALALGLPPVYEAASIVVVEPQGIPDTLVESTVVSETEARYSQLQLQILSRENLSSIISDFNLYADQGPALREELVARLREEISIEPLPPAIIDPRKPATLESFRIAFRSKRRAIVADVANRLTRDFRDAHLEDRAKLAEGASDFVRRELVKAQVELTRVRQQITAYHEEHSELQRAVPTDEGDPEKRMEALELLLNSFIAKGKTERHPDVVQTRTEIAALQAIVEGREDESPPISPAIANLQRELRNHRVNISVLTKKIETVRESAAEAELRIANTPKHAAELGRIVEWAVPPEAPTLPNRPLWFLVGSILGLVIGTLCLALGEMTDSTFHSAGELQKATLLPVLASVPEILLPADLALRRARIRRVGISSALILLLIGAGTLAFYLYGRWSEEDGRPPVPTVLGSKSGNV